MSSHRRLLSYVPAGDVIEDDRMRRNRENNTTDYSIAGSKLSRVKQSLQHKHADQEIKGEKRYADERHLKDRDDNCRCLSDNATRMSSFKDSSSSVTKRSKSESDIDINVESADKKLLLDEMVTWNGSKQSEKERQNGCEKCQRLYNRHEDNRVICTAL